MCAMLSVSTHISPFQGNRREYTLNDNYFKSVGESFSSGWRYHCNQAASAVRVPVQTGTDGLRTCAGGFQAVYARFGGYGNIGLVAGKYHALPNEVFEFGKLQDVIQKTREVITVWD